MAFLSGKDHATHDHQALDQGTQQGTQDLQRPTSPEVSSSKHPHTLVPHSEPGPIPYSDRHAAEWRNGVDAKITQSTKSVIGMVSRVLPRRAQEAVQKAAARIRTLIGGTAE
ncbi:hypothetical protein DUNSADRAFT_9422 [Dunaliella salina]|uniref:Encoded protein n=1 Tax=Dunaliella salina TaxID=3046 RepID=A0ABQ7GHJ5_DUNSA|nr:hypothetical protein DUNSADRAFT_9422 [Dunaliella salina]|eukprot:KAF5834072.1 hypothetical protein DUNSADRAFT_9422 [Dunaliella salina]